MGIKVMIESTGIGIDALSGKEGDGLTVAFENEGPVFLSFKSFKQLVGLKTSQGKPRAGAPAHDMVSVQGRSQTASNGASDSAGKTTGTSQGSSVTTQTAAA